MPHTASRLNTALDRLLRAPWLYALAIFFLVKSHGASQLEFYVAWLQGKEVGFPWAHAALYALCAPIYCVYIYRFATGRIRRRQEMLAALLALFALLGLSTLLYRGATGYWPDWLAGLALIMIVDMGLQCERESALTAFSLALGLWIFLNAAAYLAFPQGIDRLTHWRLFKTPWVLNSRVYYYRFVIPCLAFELIRAQVTRGRWPVLTYSVWALALLNLALERGGTAVMGVLLLAALMLYCRGRALPRWLNPMVMLAFSALAFIGIYFFGIQRHFSWVLENVFHREAARFDNRTQIWEAAVDIIRRYPLTGIGWLPVAYAKSLLTEPHTHNQLLELLLHGGLLALVPYTFMVHLATREALRFRRHEPAKLAAFLLMAFLFMGVADIYQNDPLYYPLFFLVYRADCLSAGTPALPCASLAGIWRRR